MLTAHYTLSNGYIAQCTQSTVDCAVCTLHKLRIAPLSILHTGALILFTLHLHCVLCIFNAFSEFLGQKQSTNQRLSQARISDALDQAGLSLAKKSFCTCF